MEGTFAAILGRQEREDAAAAHSEAALRQAVCREFLNGEELLAACGLCLTDFFAAERTALPAVPVRTAAKFGIKKHTASQRPYRHGHDFYELICVHGGCCRQRVGDTPLLLTQGQCCLLSPGAEHEMERSGRGDVILKLVIPPPLFAAADGKALLSAGSPCGAGARMFGNMPAEADYFLFLLLRECEKENAPKELWIQSCLTLLFAALARGAGRAGTAPEEALEEALSSYLAAHMREATLKGFAASLHYSPGYAGRLLRQKTGRSFSESAAVFRLRQAAALLAQTELSIEQVAAEVGYADPSAFYRQFAAAFGMTPGEYRRLYAE